MSKKDGGWGWVIVGACFVNGFIFDGVGYSYGLVFIELLDAFKESKALTAGIGSLMFGMYILGPFSGMLANRFGCRTTAVCAGTIFALGFIFSSFSTGVIFLYFSIGISVGFGFTTLELTRDVIILQYFDKRRSIARGLSICGSGIGTIVFSPLSRWLIDEYGWRGTLLIVGGLALNTIACGLLMRPLSDPLATEVQSKPRKFLNDDDTVSLQTLVSQPPMHTDRLDERDACIKGVHPTNVKIDRVDTCEGLSGEVIHTKCVHTTNSKRWLDITLFKNPYFLLSFVAKCFLGFAYFVPFTFIPEMVVSSGWTRHQATWLMTAIGITTTVTRIPMGFLLAVKCLNKVLTYAITLILLGFTVVSMPFCQQYFTLMAVCIWFGCLVTGQVLLSPLVSADLFGVKLIADTKGLYCAAFGVGSLIAGPLSGAIFDISGSYTLAFITVGVAFVLSGTLYMPMCNNPRKREAVT